MKFDLENHRLLIRQSWLNTFTTDPERARLSLLHPEMDRDSDVASLGTSVHEAIELYLTRNLELADMVAYARWRAEETVASSDITWLDLNPEQYVAHAAYLTEAWAAELAPQIPRGGMAERFFEVDTGRTVTAPDGTVWPVWFEGTIDYIPPNPTVDGVWDHKSSGRPYLQWERQRWALQPSVYTFAIVNGIIDEVSWPLDFHYGIMLRNTRQQNGVTLAAPSKTQRVSIRRFQSHGEWAVEQAATAAQFVLTNGTDKPWPSNDQHALCSEKWCAWWTLCKGKHVSNQELMWKPS